MSDLQDLIATNAVRAYNEGFERGATEERERIIALLEENWVEPMDWLTVEALIKGEQK